MNQAVRDYWDAQATTFDDEPDHGLRDSAARDAWGALLSTHLPPEPADVVDLGCGTGTLSVLLAEQGHRLRGVDLSPNMIAAAKAKAVAAGLDVTFVEGDAAEPPFEPGTADVVLCRHVLWALPDPAAALARWIGLLRPHGRLLLIEGFWSTGAGIPAAECERLVHETGRSASVVRLEDPTLWGKPIDDERYLTVSLG